MRTALTRRQAIVAALGSAAASRTGRAAAAEAQVWPSLAGQIFDKRPIADGSAILAIDAPYRAEDAAIVPITIRALGDTLQIDRLTLVIDENPSPLAATFSLGGNSGTRSVSTRVRVDAYTNIHVVAAAADGELYGVERFVKAAGGCSAPAAKQEVHTVPPGSMRFRQFVREAGADTREVQLMIRHPNYSGMQMDQVTRLYVPADFVSSVRIWLGDDLLLGIEGGISLSEDPQFRFDYRPSGAAEFRAEVQDSEGRMFKQSWSASRA